MKTQLLPRYFTVCLFLVLWFPLAIRYGIGRDYFSYVDIYNHILISRDGIEFGYYYLNYVLAYFGFHYQFIFIVTSFITILLCIKSFDKEYIVVSIILFSILVYLQSFSIIRQMLAVSICLYGCSMWGGDKKTKALFLFIIASMFHLSALIILILALVSCFFVVNSFKCFLVLVCGSIFIFIFNGTDLIFSNSYLLNSKYGYYVTSGFNRTTEIGSGIGVAITLLLPLMIFIKASRIYQYNKGYNLVLIINMVYIMSFLLSLKIYIFARLTDALSFALILLIPAALKVSKAKGLYYKTILTIAVFHIVLFEANLNANTIDAGNSSNSGLGIMPYSSIINSHILK